MAIEDTLSIITRDITTARPGETLKYADLTAVEKRDYLFDQGIRGTAYQDGQRPSVVTGIIPFSKAALNSIQNSLLSDTLTRTGDELDPAKLKLFHTYGATAKIVFTPQADSPYTGIFAETAHGLARFSYAGPVIGIGVVPGLGLKFPLDRAANSQDAVVMRKLDRQQPWYRYFGKRSHNSVFQESFTNILPPPRWLNFVMQTVNHRFETVNIDGRGLHQTVDNLASVSTDGQRVSEPRAPQRMILEPTAEARERSDPKIDFRDDLAGNIPAGTQIYRVLAIDAETAAQLDRQGVTRLEQLQSRSELIGHIATESEFIASAYGDYRLFFKHSETYIRDEFK